MDIVKNRNTLQHLIKNNRISQDNIERSVELAGMTFQRDNFFIFLRLVLLWIGALSLIIALLMFMALNWDELGKFAKFLMVELSMILSVVIYYFSDKYQQLQKILLMVASISLGIFLALIGQTYQTGADPWQLFAFWALLMTPWAVMAKSSSLWILWIVLINLASILYYQKFDLSFGAFFEMHTHLLELLFVINATLWMVWHYLGSRYAHFKDALCVRLLAFMTLGTISTLAMYAIIYAIYEEINLGMLHFLFYVVTLTVMYYFYRIRHIDIYMMSLFTLSLFFFILNIVIRLISFDFPDNIVIIVLFLLALIGGLTTVIVSWIKKLKKEQHANT